MPDFIPTNYAINIQENSNSDEKDHEVIVPGVSFVYIMTIIIKTKQ